MTRLQHRGAARRRGLGARAGAVGRMRRSPPSRKVLPMTEPHAVAYAALRERVDRGGAWRPIQRRSTGPRPRRRSGARTTCSRTSSASTDDVVNGRLDGVASDAWTAAQVDKRRDCPDRRACSPSGTSSGRTSTRCSRRAPAEMRGPGAVRRLHARARHPPRARRARRTGHRRVGARAGVDRRRRGHATGDAPIRFLTEAAKSSAGAGDPTVTVRAPRFELLRADLGSTHRRRDRDLRVGPRARTSVRSSRASFFTVPHGVARRVPGELAQHARRRCGR